MSTKRTGTPAALALAAALTLAAPASAAGFHAGLWESAWAWLGGLRAGLANVWAEEGYDLDPNGRTAPIRPAAGSAGLANAWAEQGMEWDPNGAPVPRPVQAPPPRP